MCPSRLPQMVWARTPIFEWFLKVDFSIFFRNFGEISPLLRPFNPFGRRHEARGREIRRGFESSVQSSRWRVGGEEFTLRKF